MITDNLITDRTQADVDRVAELKAKWLAGTITAEERTEWLAGLRGAYNYTDLNRIGETVKYLADALNSSGRSVTVVAKRDWTVADIPTNAQMTAFLNDLTLLKRNYSSITLAVPTSMNNLDFETANRIEQILVAVMDAFNFENAEFVRCGYATCGVEGGL